MDMLALPQLMQMHPNLKEDYTYIFLELPIEKVKHRMKKRGDCVE
jgi:deoxyadenosine/deoxycytidine kinase